MKRWLVVTCFLPTVLCAQERPQAGPGFAEQPESSARVIAYPREVPALADYERGQTPEKSAAALSAEVSSPSSVQETGPLKALPGRTGYAFDQPNILLRQRLFGLAHGVSLLAAACIDLPEQSATTGSSFHTWHDQQAKAIEQVVKDLSEYYFGAQATAAQWQDLTRALQLKGSISQALGQFELGVACASLSQALSGPRYDLAALLEMEPLVAMKIIEGRWVPPAALDSSSPVPSPSVKTPSSVAPTEEKPLPDEPTQPSTP